MFHVPRIAHLDTQSGVLDTTFSTLITMTTLATASAGLSLSADKPKNIETHHEDMIHDAQLDFYGKRLATCSSDRTVKVFDIVNGTPSATGETLHGHQGPVWQVAWAHPTFGDILASCSYDGKVIIWKDNGASTASNTASGPYGSTSGPYGGGAPASSAGGWTKIKEHALHTASGKLSCDVQQVQLFMC